MLKNSCDSVEGMMININMRIFHKAQRNKFESSRECKSLMKCA